MDEKEAKKLFAGPFGKEMSKFPLLFAKAVFFGARPSESRPFKVNSGTVTLADLGGGPIAITCEHVIAEYDDMRRESDEVLFQIGCTEIDPIAQLIDKNARLDLAIIRLTEHQVEAITSEGEIGSCVFKPRTWPPPSLNKGEYVAFGGFPGYLRDVVSFDELEFGSWSSGASEVSSVSDFQFISAFEREFWVKSFGSEHHMNLDALGGMSGGPAFINRGLYWDLAGIIYEYDKNYDAVFFCFDPVNPPRWHD